MKKIKAHIFAIKKWTRTLKQKRQEELQQKAKAQQIENEKINENYEKEQITSDN